jgi:hypothetical protein
VADVGAVAAELASMPGMWRRLLAAHVPDRLGRCAACRTSGSAGALWPCTLHRVAADARRVHGLALGRAVAGDGPDGQDPGGE